MDWKVKIPFENSYIRVSETLYSRQLPTPVKQPALIKINDRLARFLGIDPGYLASPEGIAVLSGNKLPQGAEPIATVYAGHQFGGWNPRLGDGRAILLGEVIGADGNRYDIQLKGAGPTPYSRMGDGRSPLGPVLREYIVSEAMAVLGVPTTRSLAAVATGEQVMREQILPGAILTRVAKSHIRVGTFQYFASIGDVESLRHLADHVIARHYPEIGDSDQPYLEFLEMAVFRQAELVAQWQSLGFIHGVMNTDNMLVSGETIDYGPCAFMDTYKSDAVFSSIDHHGRYAYSNQPGIAQWNLAWLAQSLLPLLNEDETVAITMAQEVLSGFGELYHEAYNRVMHKKLGMPVSSPETTALIPEFLNLLEEYGADFTLGFRALADSLDSYKDPSGDGANDESVKAIYQLPGTLNGWLEKWREALKQKSTLQASQQLMYSVNPVFIPRNHLVEEAINAAYENNFEPFHRLLEVLQAPFGFDSEKSIFAKPPRPEQVVHRTFCGT